VEHEDEFLLQAAAQMDQAVSATDEIAFGERRLATYVFVGSTRLDFHFIRVRLSNVGKGIAGTHLNFDAINHWVIHPAGLVILTGHAFPNSCAMASRTSSDIL
jgi:hypothetical protein